MTRTLSKPSVLKRLRNAGFDMDAILEQNRGEIEIGHITDGRMTEQELRQEYEEYVEYFDPTPQYLYDEPYRLLDYDEWLDEKDD